MKLMTSIVFALNVLLTSCVAVVVAGAATGLIVYDKRDLSTLEKDTRIFHKVNKSLVANSYLKNSRIIVISFNQSVLLVGQTPRASLRVLAEKIAQRTPDVRRVYDQISIEYPISITQRTNDTWITSQVRSFMLQRKGLESGSIRIVTEDAIVYLMGIVTHEQANLAVDVARHVEGVRKVVKIFQYTSRH